jgi:hypothetical protein
VVLVGRAQAKFSQEVWQKWGELDETTSDDAGAIGGE